TTPGTTTPGTTTPGTTTPELDEVITSTDEDIPLALPEVPNVANAVIASVEQTEEILEEETPLSAPTAPETDEEIIEEEVPLAAPAPELPKTGGFAPELLYAIGTGLMATGFKLRKK
ncbi:LPXTG-motif cell wall anchor domain-containing protein, partial [Acetoanaerobium noterae]